MDSPMYPRASQELREPLAMTTPPPTHNKVPRFQSPGRQENSSNRELHPSRHAALFQLGSGIIQLFPSALLLASPTLSLLQLIYLAFMAQHQNLAPRQWQDGKWVTTSTDHSLLWHLLSILDFHLSSLTASSQHQLGQKYIKLQLHGMENSNISY